MIRCVVIGSGNVATHLAKALAPHVDICQVYSRNIIHAEELARMVSNDCVAINDINAIDRDADLYLMAVSDDSIKDILQHFGGCDHGIWVHTSGSVGIDVFDGLRCRYGAFYPLQTFSKSKPVDMQQVPIFIEASDSATQRELVAIASKISGKVNLLDSEGRRRLHIAAVFACNFVNYMWIVADRQLHLCGTDIHALDPLLKETMEKIATLTPLQAQTGPARRGDRNVINRHISMLDDDDARLYELISRQILDTYHEQN